MKLSIYREKNPKRTILLLLNPKAAQNPM